jgi:aspartate racemase
MKLIGLVGGTGWISTVEYYRIINQEINRRLGGLQSAKCVLYSFNYAVIHELNEKYDTAGQYALMLDAASKLVRIGAECIVLCANTLHQFADQLEKQIPVPLIHIATATAKQIKKQNLSTVGLLATKYTMEMDFYKKKLNKENIEVLIPKAAEREFIHHTITQELLNGIFKDESKARFLQIMNRLHLQGADGIILGCTEFPLLVKQQNIRLSLFNTLEIHALAGVDFALGNNHHP